MRRADDLADLGFAVARGDAALWIGPEWQSPALEDTAALNSIAWLGVWSESTNVAFRPLLEDGMRRRGDLRLVVEVPDRVQDVLGPEYKLSELLPYFYLNGKAGIKETLSNRKRRQSREEKILELARLGPSVLVVTGYSEADSLRATILNEIAEDAPSLRALFLTGLADDDAKRLLGGPAAILDGRLRILPRSLPDVLREIQRRRVSVDQGPTVRIGSARVDLRPFLRTVPPIDQAYAIVTTADIRDPEPEENRSQLLHDLLAGRPPWRAFAHTGLVWERSPEHRTAAEDALQQFGQDDVLVRCLEIPAESGSGLTVLLQQIAFDAARAGHPTLLHRQAVGGVEYNLLRQFLTDLYQAPEMSRSDVQIPAVLIFDAPSVEADVQQAIRDLPHRLTRDARRALIIRAVAAEPTNAKTKPRTFRHGRVLTERLPVLGSLLSPQKQEELAIWARGASGSLGSADVTEIVRTWDATNAAGLPLLICLYALLTDPELRSAAGLGKHLVERILKILPEPAEPGRENEPPPTGKALEKWLQENLGRGDQEDPTPTVDEIAAVLIALAVLACLRLTVARTLLADMAGVAQDRVHAAISRLESSNLITTTLSLSSGNSPTTSPMAPVAYYTELRTAAFQHPAYGRLVIEWLASASGEAHRRRLAGGGLTEKVLEQVGPLRIIDSYPLRLLRPLAGKVTKPSDRDHVQFAADISMRYLRLPRKQSPTPLGRWQWQNVPLLLAAFEWFSEQVVHASARTLHSRGITRYKGCDPHVFSLPAARLQYQQAEADFERAIERSRYTGEDHPGNILSSLGLLYLGWADREREVGLTDAWREVDRKTEQTLRESLRERRDNPFAAFGLAKYLLARSFDEARRPSADRKAQDLAEAIELLQNEPEAYFEDEWNELRREAFGRLESEEAEQLIAGLQAEGTELGYALAALRCLHGRIPTEPTQEEQEVVELREAEVVLRAANDRPLHRTSHLADLLRYAVFSADPERPTNPEYPTRFELLHRLAGTIYLDQPIWLFDYGMLAFQVRRYAEAADAFARLRRTHRFFEVPKDRSRLWARETDPSRAQDVLLRIVSGKPGEERGWGRIEQPLGYREPIPFSLRAFASRNKNTRVGTTASCYIRLAPAGPYAEPDAR